MTLDVLEILVILDFIQSKKNLIRVYSETDGYFFTSAAEA